MSHGIGRNQELEALDVLRRRADAVFVHVAARDELGAWRYTDLVAESVVPEQLAHSESAVKLGMDGNQGMVAGGMVPAVAMVDGSTVPATIMRLQGNMIPLHAGIGVGDDHAFAVIAERPHFRRIHFRHVPLDYSGYLLGDHLGLLRCR